MCSNSGRGQSRANTGGKRETLGERMFRIGGEIVRKRQELNQMSTNSLIDEHKRIFPNSPLNYRLTSTGVLIDQILTKIEQDLEQTT